MHTMLRYQKFLAGVLVASLISPVFPIVALAQTIAGGSNSRGGNGLDSLVQDTTGAIAAAAISCEKNNIQSGIASLFSGSGGDEDVASSLSGDLAGGIATDASSLDGSGAFGGSSSGSTADQQVHFAPGSSTTSELKAISQASQKSASEAAAATTKATCTNAIEKAAAGVILRQLTISTVNWINHGLNGNPFYSTDTASALKSVRDTTIKSLNSTLGFDSKNYPFGKSVAQMITKQLQTSYEEQAKSSLNAVIAQQFPTMTSADYQRNFGIGGWDAFLAQTALNNNPFGFAMQTQNVIANRISGTSYSPAQDLKDQLARSGGFFDQKVCMDPNYNPDADTDATSSALSAAEDKAAATDAADATATNDLANAQASGDQTAIQIALAKYNAYQALDAQANDDLAKARTAAAAASAKSTCSKWVVQTPGSIIGQSLTKALGATNDTLVNGQDLSTDITAIFNALSNQLINKGLSSLSTTNVDTSNFKNNSNGTTSNNSSVSVTDNSGSWSTQGSNFNVFTDIPSVIRYEDNSRDETALATGCTSAIGFNDRGQFCAGNSALPEGYQQILQKEVDAGEKTLVSIYELDYCVPGPHPGAIDAIDANAKAFVTDPTRFPASADASAFHKVLSTYGASIGAVTGLAVGAAIGTAVFPGFGTAVGAVVGLIVGIVLQIIGNNHDFSNEKAYGPFVSSIIGVEFEYNGDGRADLNGHDNSANIVTTLAHRYYLAMQMVYAPTQVDKTAADAAADSDPAYPNDRSGDSSTVPDLSTTNAARAKTIDAGVNAQSDIADLIALDRNEFQNISTVRDSKTQNQARLDNSKAIESQLERLITRINLLPTQDGYPGLTGPLDLVPVITLKGNKIMTLNVGDVFIDPGAVANDKTDLSITNNIVTVSNVNTAAAGIYTVTYDVTDSLGIAANQVVRSVRVVDPNGNVGQVVLNSAVKGTAIAASALDIHSINASLTSGATVRDYNKDLQAIVNITNISNLTPYEAELKRISNTFQQLAPYIHGVADLKREEALLDTMQNEAANITDPKNGALAECIKETTDPNSLYLKDGGPTSRVAFGFMTSTTGPIETLPADLLKQIPPQQSFLPDWHYAQGGGLVIYGKNWFPNDGQAPYPPGIDQQEFRNGADYIGAGMHVGSNVNASDPTKIIDTLSGSNGQTITVDLNKLIRNNDVSVINKQSPVNALVGLEQILNMY